MSVNHKSSFITSSFGAIAVVVKTLVTKIRLFLNLSSSSNKLVFHATQLIAMAQIRKMTGGRLKRKEAAFMPST